jgi:hypothetical protein
MSTPKVSALFAGVVAAVGVLATPIAANTAEMLLPAAPHVRHHYAAICRGPCGCLHVSYVYHKELRSTYGLSFDPRNFDQTQPSYHFGPRRAYPRYWVDPVQ